MRDRDRASTLRLGDALDLAEHLSFYGRQVVEEASGARILYVGKSHASRRVSPGRRRFTRACFGIFFHARRTYANIERSVREDCLQRGAAPCCVDARSYVGRPPQFGSVGE